MADDSEMEHVATVHQRRSPSGAVKFDVHVDSRVISLAHKLSQLSDVALTELLSVITQAAAEVDPADAASPPGA